MPIISCGPQKSGVMPQWVYKHSRFGVMACRELSLRQVDMRITCLSQWLQNIQIMMDTFHTAGFDLSSCQSWSSSSSVAWIYRRSNEIKSAWVCEENGWYTGFILSVDPSLRPWTVSFPSRLSTSFTILVRWILFSPCPSISVWKESCHFRIFHSICHIRFITMRFTNQDIEQYITDCVLDNRLEYNTWMKSEH